jgi:HEAT repeat protein
MMAAMPERIWSFDDLRRFIRYEDPEVRHWAADRLARHHPDRAADVLAPYLFDEHDLTPELVAAHLGEHGGPAHVPVLARGARSLRGLAAARAIEALVRLRAPEALDLVKTAADRRDFDEECWGCIVEALADSPDPPARRQLREFLKKRADWSGLPVFLRSALKITEPEGYGPVLKSWIRSMQWRPAESEDIGEAFRVLMDHLEIDDCGWCFRTDLRGRIDLARTLKAIEAAYDCDLAPALGEAATRQVARMLEGGAYEAITAALAEAVKTRARAASRRGDGLAGRIADASGFWVEPETRAAVEGLGPGLRDRVIGFLLAALVKMGRYRDYGREVGEAAGDLDRLLDLLQQETSAMLDTLPPAIAGAVEAAPGEAARAAARRRAEERCLAILASRGPFFPHVMALETLGELRSTGAINEILDFLSEDNSYLYEAAEHALGKMGDAFLEAARARLEAQDVDEDAGHSLLVLLCELGTPRALEVVLEHFDFFAEAAGAGDAARWMSLFGARELIDPLRRLLPRNVAQVGQGLLLLAAIHNVRVPEEGAIQRAIDEYYKQPPGGEGSEGPGSADGTDKYLM